MRITRIGRPTKRKSTRLLQDEIRLTHNLSRMRRTIASMKAMLQQYEQGVEGDGGQFTLPKPRGYKLPIIRINHYEI